MKSIFAIVMVIIGSVIGAGFASGQEINSFFYKYGASGVLGLVVSVAIISFIIYKVFKIAITKNINTYKEFLETILNKQKRKYLNIANITNTIINIFLIISFFIMIAGFGAYFEQEYNLNSLIGSMILAGICFIIFMRNVEGLLKINKYLVPILIIFMLLIGYMNIGNSNLEAENITGNWCFAILSGTVYASFNIILLIPVLIALKNKIKKNAYIKYVALLSGMVLLILALIIFFLIADIEADINSIEMPAVYAIGKYFPSFRAVYGFIILAAILTTAISEGISLLENVCKTKKGYTQVAAILCITSVFFSKIGFSNLINLLYPVFGILGLVQILIIIKARASD